MRLPRFVLAVPLALILGCDAGTLAGPDAAVDLTARSEAQDRPLVFVDGHLRAPGFDLRRLARKDIISIEIVRNPAATTLYGPAARAGVIHISTRAGR